ATDWQRCELRAVTGPDVGLGERELRRELTELLNQRLPDPSAARRRLRQVIDHARVGYLERWAQAAHRPDRPKAERLSRTVAAHLLDLGYSQEYLLRWASQLRQARAAATETVESAAELAGGSEQEYEVLVGLAKVPQRSRLAEPLENWRSKAQVIDWLRQHGHVTAGVRTGGGFVYRFVTRDPHGAAAQARQMVDRLVARSAFLRRDRGGVEPLPYVWVAEHPEPISLVPAGPAPHGPPPVHAGPLD